MKTIRKYDKVLILVVMEYGRGDRNRLHKTHRILSLNPCYNGKWSRGTLNDTPICGERAVLILVLMEDGLGLFYV